MRWARVLIVLLTLGIFLAGATPQVFAAITWDFEYVNPGSDIGFFAADASVRNARRQALENSAAEWGAKFANTGTITLKVTSSEDGNSSTLASANGATINNPAKGFGNQQVIRNKILKGTDLNGADADGSVDVNWGVNWETSTNKADIDGTEYDFTSTIYHELTHALGFGSAILQNGEDWSGTPVGNPGSWDLFDKYIVDADGNKVIDPSTYVLDDMFWSNSAGGASPANGLFFNGPNAVAANGGNPVGLFTPTTWSDGSSGSHIDDENDAYKGFMMLAETDTGAGSHSLSEIELGIMKDIGYTVVPLPSAIMLFGPGLIGLAMIRRRRN